MRIQKRLFKFIGLFQMLKSYTILTLGYQRI
jgi:hypothetical protein